MSLMRHNLQKYGGLSGIAVLARCDCDMDKVQVLLSPPGVSDRECGIQIYILSLSLGYSRHVIAIYELELRRSSAMMEPSSRLN